MSIRQATISDFDAVMHVTTKTITEIYPHYYPEGAVDYFLCHHSELNIRNDIAFGRVFICIDLSNNIVGTVTVKENEICRLFVLPESQGMGFGRELLEFAEGSIFDLHSEITLDASLPTKSLYLKRGYKDFEYNAIKTDNGDYLCYDVMVKRKRNSGGE